MHQLIAALKNPPFLQDSSKLYITIFQDEHQLYSPASKHHRQQEEEDWVCGACLKRNIMISPPPPR
jgi:hypothetical protein